MRIVEIGEGESEAEEEALVDQDRPELDGPSDLSPTASFARLSFCSAPSPSSSSSPAFPLSPSRTPFDRRAIGRDIEERVCLDWLPFTYEEWYGHPNPTVTRVSSVRGGKLAAKTADVTDAIFQPLRLKIVLRMGDYLVRSSPPKWNPLKKLLRSILGLKSAPGGYLEASNAQLVRMMALKAVIGFIGVFECHMDRSDNTMTIIGHGVDPERLKRRLRVTFVGKKGRLRKKMAVDLLMIEVVQPEQPDCGMCNPPL